MWHSRPIQLCQLCFSFDQRPNISDRFFNLASHFIRVQIFQRYFSLKNKKKLFPTSYCNFPIVKCLFSGWQFGDSLEEEKTHWRKVRQLWRKPLCTKIYIFLYIWGILSEDTSESPKCKEIKQMQLVKLCSISDRSFEETFENTLWRKVKLMQPMWLWAGQGRGFEDTFENTLHHIFIKAPFGVPIQF